MKGSIVALLLTGFLGVFMCDALCDLGVISMGNYLVTVQEVDHHQTNDHDHDADSDHRHVGNNESDEDECCDEEVSNFYASLIKYELKQNSVQIAVFCLPYQVFELGFQEKVNQKKLSFFYANLPPPIGGYLIRIFFQSFLI